MQELADHRAMIQTFRRKWGQRAPASAEDWSIFWGEFRLLEDRLDEIGDMAAVPEGIPRSPASVDAEARL